MEYIDHHRSELADEPQMQSITSSPQFVEAFQLYAINIYPRLEAFKIDLEFSTYYDIKVAKIIADNMFYNYLKDQLDFLEQQKGGILVNKIK